MSDMPPAPTEPEPAGIPLAGKILIGVVGAAILAAVIGGIGSSGSDSDSSDLSGQVRDVCHQRVSDQLKAPSTAKFTDLETYPGVGSRWYATGDVDSENSFGAMVRSGWTCTAIHTGGSDFQVRVRMVQP